MHKIIKNLTFISLIFCGSFLQPHVGFSDSCTGMDPVKNKKITISSDSKLKCIKKNGATISCPGSSTCIIFGDHNNIYSGGNAKTIAYGNNNSLNAINVAAVGKNPQCYVGHVGHTGRTTYRWQDCPKDMLLTEEQFLSYSNLKVN